MCFSIQSTNSKNTSSRQGLAVVIMSCLGPHAHTLRHKNQIMADINKVIANMTPMH